MKHYQKSVALLATGDELVRGEVLDTNSQYFAKTLTALGIDVLSQQLVCDTQSAIERALIAQLAEHDCVIVCGGLGPTSDDLTRFAIAAVLQRPLIFHDQAWHHICQRLQNFGLTIHESNKQQALFPQDAELLPNLNGTAAACLLHEQQKIIYMLPGPPKECIPIFDKYIVPYLQQHNYIVRQQVSWKLLGVIESEIAETIDNFTKQCHAATAYRWNYPYLDVKLSYPVDIAHSISTLMQQIDTHLSDYLVSRNNQTSLELLHEWLQKQNIALIYLHDELTCGRFAKVFGHADIIHYIVQRDDQITHNIAPQEIYAHCTGLAELWQQTAFSGKTKLTCSITYNCKTKTIAMEIPYRGSEVIDYAVHFIAYCLVQFLNKEMNTSQAQSTAAINDEVIEKIIQARDKN
jgi:molybdenum cofactor synthesis domain-containing protein